MAGHQPAGCGPNVSRRSLLLGVLGFAPWFPAAPFGLTVVGADQDGPPLPTGRGPAPTPAFDGPKRPYRAFQLAQFNKVNAIAFSPDGKLLAAACGHMRGRLWDGVTNVYYLETRKLAAQFRGHEDSSESVAFSPDGKTLATGGDSRDVILWDLATRRLKSRSEPDAGKGQGERRPNIRCIRFSRDGQRLASLDDRARVRVWDLRQGFKELMPYELPEESALLDIAFAPDDTLRVLEYGRPSPLERRALNFWDSTKKQPLWSRETPRDNSVGSISHDLKFVTTLDTRQHHFWSKEFDPAYQNLVLDAKTGGVVSRYSTSMPISGLCFSPDGQHLALATQRHNTLNHGLMCLIDTNTGKAIGQFDTPGEFDGLVFSPDGRLLASDENDETVTIRKVADILNP